MSPFYPYVHRRHHNQTNFFASWVWLNNLLSCEGFIGSSIDLYRLKDTNECRDCDLKGACLKNIDLSLADLTDANLIGADLSNADLTDADLIDADLIRATLSETILIGADLTRADLSDATLYRSSLANANVNGAIWTDGEVICEVAEGESPKKCICSADYFYGCFLD
jgi:uncharacterized protein YjbI with pentapeptide repeats